MKKRWLLIMLVTIVALSTLAIGAQGPYIQFTEPKLPTGEVFTTVSGVDKLQIGFTERVVFGSADVSILDEYDVVIPSTVSGSGTAIMKIEFGVPLLHNTYTITIHDSVKGYGTLLAIDGDRDGISGGDAVIAMKHRKRNDFNDDNQISFADLSIFAECWLSDGPPPTSIQLQKRNLLTGIMPEPQDVYDFVSSKQDFKFKNSTVLVVENSADLVGAELLAEDLLKRSGLNLNIVEGSVPSGATSFVLLGRSDVVHSFENHTYPLNELGETKREGYRMVVDSVGVVIEGYDERGTLYGVQTLRQLINSDATVKAIAIRDWPQMEWRLSYPGLIEISDITEHIKRCARLKINGIVLETNWAGGQNWWYSPSAENQAKANLFFSECRKYKIEPIPLIQGFGWGYGATDRDPMTAEGEWIQNEAVVLHYGMPTQLTRANVVATNTGPIVVKDQQGNLCVEGQDYTVIPGYTERPYYETNTKWQLQAKPGGQIADGETVLVSYNAVSPNAHQAYCPSEPRTYNQVDMAIDYTINLYNPLVIHIGHDEVWQSSTDSRCISRGLPEAEIILADVMHWYNRVKRHHPNVKVIMWYDLLRIDSGKLLSVADRLPKDIILAPWIYETGPQQRAAMESNLNLEASLGFQSIGTSAGYWISNSLDWHNALMDKLSPQGSALGMIYSVWGGGRHHEVSLPSAAELMWHGQDSVNIELYNTIASKINGMNQELIYLTFELNGQRDTLANYFNTKLRLGMSPQEVASGFNSEFIGDETIFFSSYGESRWVDLENAPFPEQQTASLQKFGILFDLMALYADAEYENWQGHYEIATNKLSDVIQGLLEISYFDYKKASSLQENATQGFLLSEEVFGSTLDAYRP